MKLYYSPGACSLSPHIAAREAGQRIELVKVDLKTKKLPDGSDFNRINAKSYVPVLELDNGEILTEGPAIVQYIADQSPAANLAPANGSFARVRLQEMLNFITSELHKSFGPLFKADASSEWKAAANANLSRRFDYLSAKLDTQPYLLGEQFTVADGYLFTILLWTRWVNIDLKQWPVLQAFFDRVAARPKVKEALAAEDIKL